MTANKRLKEARRRDQQREKAERKRARKEKAAAEKTGGNDPEEDPDIAGIVPGPQPMTDDPGAS
jgi:hypothetical protein